MNLKMTLAFCLLSLSGYSQSPVVFNNFDIRSGTSSSNPCNFDVVGDKLFFSAQTDAYGRELWVSDGTMAGTHMILDIMPGTASGVRDWNSQRTAIIQPDKNKYKYIFIAADSTHGEMLWVTDGTAAGTHLIKDIYPNGTGFAGANPTLGVYNNKVYFNGRDKNDDHLWVTDGTDAGTYIVKYIKHIQKYIEFNSKLYFNAQDTGGVYGQELWVTDGSEAGTHMVKNIGPGSLFCFYNPPHFTVYNGKLYFYADDSTHGLELWSTDGTTAGTQLVKDIFPGKTSSIVLPEFTVFNGKLYFSADDGVNGQELWVTDGTAAGTQLAIDIFPGSVGSGVNGTKVINGLLYFLAETNNTCGHEPMVSDGTKASTRMIKDINAGNKGSSSGPYLLYNHRTYFLGYYPGQNLWQTDNTTANTIMIAPATSTTANKGIRGEFIEYKGSLYFDATYDNTGHELWSITDTTNYTNINQIASHNFSLYPNPNTGTFTLETTNDFKNGTVSVYDIMGREVYSQSQIPNHKFQITISEAKGIYLVKLQLDDAVLTKRVVIE